MSDPHEQTSSVSSFEEEDEEEERISTKLGQYVIIQDIAEGTFGKVKMAKHVLTGQRVAMKYLSKEAINVTGTKTRVMREVQYMRMLKHIHIVKLYEVISTPLDIIIVLEYASGELFNYIVNNGHMSETQARRLFQQLMSGVDYSHRLKIVHRDLKPENVLLDEDFNVKIADFGLSNTVQDGEFLHTSCGSPNYAAPEVIRGLRYVGPEVDVWSCGVILYVMLCGRLPFEGPSVNTLFDKINKGEYHEPAHLSSESRTLIARMLAVDPVKRITVPEILETNFFKTDLPAYLEPLPPLRGPLLGTLMSLVSPPRTVDFEYINGLGRIEEDIVQALADSLDDVPLEVVWHALRMDDGTNGNAVKVAYMLLRDKRRTGPELAEFGEKERDAQLAVMDPTINLSPLPLTLSPRGILETNLNPYEMSFEADPDDDSDEFDDGIDWDIPDSAQQSHFAVLHSSLPGAPGEPPMPPPTTHAHLLPGPTSALAFHNTHNLTATMTMATLPMLRDSNRKPRWHFGIRSRSPPLEVMLEIYRTLSVLDMEWKEKKYLGGLGGERTNTERFNMRRGLMQAQDGEVQMDPKVAASIYYVETRARVDDIVVLLDLQLYEVDEVNYLVDFKHQGYYKASSEPGAKKFDRAASPPPSNSSDAGSTFGDEEPLGATEKEKRRREREVEDDKTVSPFLFMDTACRLILELAGGGAEPLPAPMPVHANPGGMGTLMEEFGEY